MILHCWRMVKGRYAGEAFSGEGARRFGGRWNSPGVPVVYCAEHASLAVLEVLAHLEAVSLLASYLFFRARFEDTLMESLEETVLPPDARAYPAPAALKALGDGWAREGRSAVLSVPSAIIPHERLFLLNPRHPDFQRVQVEGPLSFALDPRLIKS